MKTMLRGIVGIEIPVQRWIGKFKTSQKPQSFPNLTELLTS